MELLDGVVYWSYGGAGVVEVLELWKCWSYGGAGVVEELKLLNSLDVLKMLEVLRILEGPTILEVQKILEVLKIPEVFKCLRCSPPMYDYDFLALQCKFIVSKLKERKHKAIVNLNLCVQYIKHFIVWRPFRIGLDVAIFQAHSLHTYTYIN